MPDRLAYDEAMMFSQVRLKIQDPELKQGKVETYESRTAVGSISKPWGIEGGFAVVYKFRTLSGQPKAFRCFRTAIGADTQQRYERINSFFRSRVPEITIDVVYHDGGIVVNEAIQGVQRKLPYPVIIMDWVEGKTLVDVVNELCLQRDRQALQILTEQWLGILNRMRDAGMAHGDLAGVNVMVRDDGCLVLIDYDGIYIPEFAGMNQIVLGQPAYQHPDMEQRPFNEHMDAFSALVIYLALYALQINPTLWNRYCRRNAQGQLDGNMLFTREDFLDPDSSPLFVELERSADAQVRTLIRELKQACNMPVEQVRFPQHLLDAEYLQKRELQLFEQALQWDDDERILDTWTANLDSYPAAQQHQSRVQLARQRVQALQKFRGALSQQNIFTIASSYVKELEASRTLTEQEHALARVSWKFVLAYQKNDDEQIFDAWEEIEEQQFQTRLALGAIEQQRLQLAQQRKKALTVFRLACHRSRKARDILAAYQPVLDGCSGISAEDREKLEAAHRYMLLYNEINAALQSGTIDRARISAVYDEELIGRFQDFSAAQLQSIEGVRNFERLDRALSSKAYGLAVHTAREIERKTHEIIDDDRLSLARRRFIRQFEPRDLHVQIQGQEALAQWEWPSDELVQYAVLVWHEERWPQHPKHDDLERKLYRVHRSAYHRQDAFRFAVGSRSSIYVQVFFAIAEYSDFGSEANWYYSRGSEPSSKVLTLVSG